MTAPDWGALRAMLCMSTGWTWDYIGEHMDIPRLKAFQRHWKESPPVHIALAAIFRKEQEAPADLSELAGLPGVTVTGL